MNIHELRTGVADYCREQIRQRQLPDWWRDPLLATAEADDRFDVLSQIAASNHMRPAELMNACRTVVVFFIPFSATLSNGNIEGKFPSDGWGLSLSLTNDLIERISEFIRHRLEQDGYQSELTPATYNFDPDSLSARWSHKHLAHLCGLGRFGTNAQLITPAGCAGRLGSLVTEAPLGNHPLVEAKALCLHKVGQDCLKCLQTWPVQAITLHGIDRHRCNQRLQINRKRFAAKPDMREDIEVCAKCVSGMPCDLQAPAGVVDGWTENDGQDVNPAS
jgi:epoxyqueuosine reductase QueG